MILIEYCKNDNIDQAILLLSNEKLKNDKKSMDK